MKAGRWENRKRRSDWQPDGYAVLQFAQPRLPAEHRAAGLRGRSRTDFVRAAEDVLMENRLIRMSAEGFAEFMAALSAPATSVPEMVELEKRSAPWEPDYVAKS